ncbi:MAG: DUF1861 family protein [Turicibacter sp.]
MELTQGKIQFVDDVLQAFRNKEEKPTNANRPVFAGIDNKDVYNPTAPFMDNGQLVIAGRVESRDSEHSEVIFFVEQDGAWVPRKNTPTFVLQDPYFAFVQGELVVGGTEIFPHPENPEALWWHARFLKGKDINSLETFVYGPNGMKDIRLVELQDGRVGVFSRPQGQKGGRGKVGFTVVESLAHVTPEVIQEAPLLTQFDDEEWGGVNAAYLLSNGKIGVLGHIAKMTEGDVRHYYPMAFCVDVENGTYSEMEILAERANLLDGPAKREDLIDVLFSAGLVRHGNGMATLYTGVSDVEVQSCDIQDPFIKFEM